MTDTRLVTLPPSRSDDIVRVFCDAFRDYPLMRFVLGPDRHDERLPALIGLFVAGRALRGEPMFGVEEAGGGLVAAATMSRPDGSPPPEAFLERRESVWRELGPVARARYEAFGATTDRFKVADPHLHLNMIGVRRSHAGRGLARTLLAAVSAHTNADAEATGTTLSTENAANVPFYQHFGYRVLGHAAVGEGLETWCFFRPRDPDAVTPA